MGLAGNSVKIIWDYVCEKIDAEEAARRLGKAFCGTVGGIAINHGATALASAVGSSLGPVGQFVCTVAGNAVGQYLADKFYEFLAWMFQSDPKEGFRRACQELGVDEQADRRTIKRAFARRHPDKGSGLDSGEYEKKKVAFELVKAFKNQNNTWDDDDDDN